MKPRQGLTVNQGFRVRKLQKCLEYQLQLGSFSMTKNPTKVGTLNTIDSGRIAACVTLLMNITTHPQSGY
jgi:hypothetical protein